MKAVSNSSEGE
jgi:translation initiation factor 2 beta subunit (eIF-2beta)/eIF-5